MLVPSLAPQSVEVKIEEEVVTRSRSVGFAKSTGRGIYCYDPDGLMVEIRCDGDIASIQSGDNIRGIFG